MGRAIYMCMLDPLICELVGRELTLSPSSIVGKGNHSSGHIQKIKPRVEQVCRELGLQYATEENAGRIYVNLTGGEAVMPPYSPQHPSPHYPGQQPSHHQKPQQQDGVEQVVNEVAPKVVSKMEKLCCVVM